MDKRCFTLFLCLLFGGFAYSQVAPQFYPVINKRKTLTGLRIVDTISTDGKPVIVNRKFEIPQVINIYPPNFLGKSMMTPSAWGHEGGGVAFAGLGGSFPQIYTARPDMMGVVGLAFGNPRIKIGAIASVNINDVSRFRTFSANLLLNKRLSEADAVAIGGIHMLSSNRTDASPSYYIVYSHAVQSVLYNDEDQSRLHYSIGAGSGRFYLKSPADSFFYKRNIHGTILFGNVSFGLTKWMNVTAEWSGVNLHTGISLRPVPSLPAISLGLADLTRNSGDRIRFIASINYAYPLWD